MNDEDDLPVGWAKATLREVVEDCQPGFASGEKDVAGGVAHLRMNNIGVRGEIITSLLRHVPKTLAKEKYLLNSGDVLVCTTNSAKLVGKCTYFDLPGRYVFSNHLTRLRPLTGLVDGRFLRWNLWLQWKRGAFEDKCKHWVNQSALPKEDLLETQVELPPLAEQRRIVSKAEGLIAKVDANRERLRRIAVILKRFREAVLTAACSGRLTADWREANPPTRSVDAVLEAIKAKRQKAATTPTQRKNVERVFSLLEENAYPELPDSWRYVTLTKLCTSFDYGTAAKSSPTGSVPVLRMGNIQNGEIDWTDLVYTSDRGEIASYLLQPNTVLFNRTNSPELVGKTAIYRGERPAVFAGYLIRANPVPELDPEYLNYCLNTKYAKDFCSRVKTDGVSQSNINAQRLGGFEVPFCSLQEQREIVRRVKEFFSLAGHVERRLATARTCVDTLTPALLAKAFRGELMPPEAELRRHGSNSEGTSTLVAGSRRERTSPAAFVSQTSPKRSLRSTRTARATTTRGKRAEQLERERLQPRARQGEVGRKANATTKRRRRTRAKPA